MSELTETIVTGEAGKLPPRLAALVDETQPIPPGVTFFERKVTVTEQAKMVVVAVVLLLLAVVCVPFGLYEVASDFRHSKTVYSRVDWLPLGFGLVCALAAWMLLANLGKSRQLMRRQQAGERTRLGLFVLPDALLYAAEAQYTVVPRSHFRGIIPNGFQYAERDQVKPQRLPSTLVNGDVAAMNDALVNWSRQSA